MMRASVDLPEPDGPTSASDSPDADGEAHLVERDQRRPRLEQRDIGLAEAPRELAHLEHVAADGRAHQRAGAVPAGREQHLGVVVLGVAEHVELVADLDHLAAPHHHDLGAERGDGLEVVRDEHQRHAALGADAVDQIEHLALRDEIERRGRLVADQQVRLARQRHGDHHALPLAARQFVRIARRVARLEPDFGEAASRPRP